MTAKDTERCLFCALLLFYQEYVDFCFLDCTYIGAKIIYHLDIIISSRFIGKKHPEQSHEQQD